MKSIRGIDFSENDRQCMLVIIGADEWGNKDVPGLIDGFRESTQSWRELLLDLKRRGLEAAPKLAVGDGAMGFRTALHEVYGKTRVQRCWVHKTANALNALPKSMQPKARASESYLDGGNQGRGRRCLRFLHRGLRSEI